MIEIFSGKQLDLAIGFERKQQMAGWQDYRISDVILLKLTQNKGISYFINVK